MASLKKLAALISAGALVFAIAGTALAATGASDQGVTPIWHDGNITADGNGQSDGADCSADDAIETGDSAGSGDSVNGVHVAWTYDATTKAFGFTATGGFVSIAYVKGGSAYNEYNYTGFTDGGVTSDGNMFAPDNGSDGPAGLSHAVFCTTPGETTTTTTTTTDTTTTDTTTTDTTTTDTTTTDTTTTDTTTTDTTTTDTFSSDTGGATDAPSEPNTATVGTYGTGAPADGAWMLVIALGVLLASIVVLSPAKARNHR